MSEIAIFAASMMEYRILRGALTGWQPNNNGLVAGQGRCGQLSVDLFCTEMGPQNAARITARALTQSDAALVLVSGFAGALAPVYQCGDIIIYQYCRNFDGESLDCDELFVNRLQTQISRQDLTVRIGVGLTIPKVLCSAVDKRAAAERHGATAVDMESYQVIAAARAAGRRAAVVRVISDDAHSDLPDLNAGLGSETEVNNLKMIASFVTHPLRAGRFLYNLRLAGGILKQLLPAAIGA